MQKRVGWQYFGPSIFGNWYHPWHNPRFPVPLLVADWSTRAWTMHSSCVLTGPQHTWTASKSKWFYGSYRSSGFVLVHKNLNFRFLAPKMVLHGNKVSLAGCASRRAFEQKKITPIWSSIIIFMLIQCANFQCCARTPKFGVKFLKYVHSFFADKAPFEPAWNGLSHQWNNFWVPGLSLCKTGDLRKKLLFPFRDFPNFAGYETGVSARATAWISQSVSWSAIIIVWKRQPTIPPVAKFVAWWTT